MTRKEKELVSSAVTGETKRMLAIINRHLLNDRELRKIIIREAIEQQPYIEFHQELLKRIPQ